MGKINEITVPSVSGELTDNNHPATNNPVNPKSFDLRPQQLRRRPKDRHPNSINGNPKPYDLRSNELKKRNHAPPMTKRRLTPPFPG